MNEKATQTSEGDDRSMALTARNLAYLMSKKGVDAATLSEVTKLGIATINSLRRGVGNPTLSTMVGLARFFNVSLSELTEIDLSKKRASSGSAKTIPLIKLHDVNKFIDGSLDGYDEYTTEIEDSSGRSHFAVSINNDSLAPHFSAGTVFVVARDEELNDGDIVLVRIGAHSPCFRKIFIDGDNYLFSPVVLESDASPSAYKTYEIVGVILKAIKTFSDK